MIFDVDDISEIEEGYEIKLEKKDKEIERLNNIINELRKYIGNEYYCFDNESLEFKIAKDILNKIQELKGDGSNEKDIIKEFVCSDNFIIINDYITKPYEETIKEQDKEIERLNKGIKELDDMFYETFRISQNGYYSISEWVLKEFIDKIKELKGE